MLTHYFHTLSTVLFLLNSYIAPIFNGDLLINLKDELKLLLGNEVFLSVLIN